ncbi:hypothetical protein [Nannocystis sp. SCPEA4]|uniref:hypothetical protein n=1 Tax=Nannocystis sp. SCPEA4 TaxID=2996787 RepID=UPI00226DF67B|nr:hypothetical protein [Nannocystis sp. SCPEA4]MCY1058950.1 hypothetical protein [Nannocystis sp. SCPEA4]
MCLAEGPIRLVESDNPRFEVDFAGGHTYVSFRGDWVSDLEHALYVGEACGADAELIDFGLSMKPVRLHPDEPDAEDPSLVCSYFDGKFYRLDLDGSRGPELLLPRLHCPTLVATPHGPVVGERNRPVLWHLPEFPDETRAVELDASTDIDSAVWLGDRLLYVGEGGIRRRDLGNGEDELLVPGAVGFEHTDTHLLWQGALDGDSAPMHVFDLTTGEDHVVGVYHASEDEQQWDDPGPGWRFDLDGAHVLHLPNVPDSSISAYDLTGAQVPFAGTGIRLAHPPGGGVILQDGATIRHAFAGSATGTVLDVPAGASLEDLQVFADRLEVLVGSELHAVPLDGSPSRLLVRQVGAARTRVDDDRLITLVDHDLVLVHQPSGDWRYLDHHVERFEYHPGRGVYYHRLLASGADGNGVWLLPDDRIPSVFAD